MADAAPHDSADVETAAAYRERKAEELALLCEAAGVGAAPGLPLDTAELVAEKQRLRARILARAVLEDPALAESNLTGGIDRRYLDGRVAFGYQRWDARWATRRFADWAYPPAGRVAAWPAVLSLGLLTSSGMAAVTAALGALDHVLPRGTPLLLPLRAYFETLAFAAQHLGRLVPTPRGKGTPWEGSVLLLDSITPEDEPSALTQPLGPLAAIVFDTTCYDTASPRIAGVVARAVAEGVPLILVRSHLKLDCLGTEYGRLGSIVLVLPRPAAPAALRFARALRRGVIETLALHGATFTPQHIFPAAHEPTLREKFWPLNRRRNQRIVASNARAGAALSARAHEESATRIRRHHHDLFFVVEPLSDGAAQVGQFAEELRAALVGAGVHAILAPSFGYDFVALSHLRGGNSYYHTSALRIALPDASTEAIDRFIAVAGDWAVGLDPWRRG
jgi:hypothetical protein